MVGSLNPQPLYLQIAGSIARRTRSGELAIGDRPPSESSMTRRSCATVHDVRRRREQRQLAGELPVSRMTVSQAPASLRLKELGGRWRAEAIYSPRTGPAERDACLERRQRAVSAVRRFHEGEP